jgi:hypothetical protein
VFQALPEEGLDLRLVGDVGRHAGEALLGFQRFAERGLIHITNEDPGAGIRERLRRRKTDAARSGRDEDTQMFVGHANWRMASGEVANGTPPLNSPFATPYSPFA